jgi:negative regulator of sigma E activity
MPDQTRDPGCEPVADALPDLLHGRLAGEARSRAERHVAMCERCASELALLGGARAAIRGDAPALDVAAIAAAVRAATVPDARAVRPPRRAAPPRVTAPSRWRAGAGPRAVVAAMLLAVGAGTVWFTDRTITGSFTATPAVDAAGPPADATARADSQASAPTVLAAAIRGSARASTISATTSCRR